MGIIRFYEQDARTIESSIIEYIVSMKQSTSFGTADTISGRVEFRNTDTIVKKS
jgi:hypothetical protein